MSGTPRSAVSEEEEYQKIESDAARCPEVDAKVASAEVEGRDIPPVSAEAGDQDDPPQAKVPRKKRNNDKDVVFKELKRKLSASEASSRETIDVIKALAAAMTNQNAKNHGGGVCAPQLL